MRARRNSPEQFRTAAASIMLTGACLVLPAGVRAQAVEDQEITIQSLRVNHVPVVRQARPKPKPTPKPTPVEVDEPEKVPARAGELEAAAATAANRAAAALEDVADGRQQAGPGESPSPLMAATRPGRGVPASALAEPERLTNLPLTLTDFVAMVRERNNKILAERLEWQVAEEGVANARSQFELEFVGSALHEENKQRNTVQEALQRSSFSDFREFNERYDGAVEQNLVTGGKLRTGYHLDALNNNLQTAAANNGLDSFNEFRTFIGSTLTQPLLRNRGGKVARARIHVAQKDRDIAFQVFRRELMRVVAESVFAYVELAASQKRYEFRKESVRIAQTLLETNREKVKLGLLADTEIMEAEAGLSQRQANLRAAGQDVVTATARVRNFIAAVPGGFSETKIEATDELIADPVNSDLTDSLITAARLAPEYVAAKKRAEREGIKLEFAKNQRLPQLDMRASYGVNGLDTSPTGSFSDAFQSDNKNWNVLAEFRVPLDGGIRTSAELKVAEYHKKQALLQIKNTEVELANAVDTALHNVEAAAGQIRQFIDATQKGEELLKVELQRLESGMSTSRQVLTREEDLNRVREERLKSLIAYKRAGLELELTRGSLLERFGMEVTNVGAAQRPPRPKKG